MSILNKRLIGQSLLTSTEVSGVFEASEIAKLESRDSSLLYSNDRDALTESSWPSAGNDPYSNHVQCHLQTAEDSSDLLIDRSTYKHIVYIDSNYNRYSVGVSGPKTLMSHWFRDQYYTVTDHTSLRLGTSAFTIDFWFMLHRQHGTEHYIMGKGSTAARSSGTGWVIFLSSTYQIGFYDAVSNQSVTSVDTLARDTWHHVAFVRSSTATDGFKIYVNGLLSATGTIAGNFSDTNNFYIGRDRVLTSTTYFGGKLFDLRMESSALFTNNFSVPTTVSDKTTSIFSLDGDASISPIHTSWHRQGRTITRSSAAVQKLPEFPFVGNVSPWIGMGHNNVHFSSYFCIWDHTSDRLKFYTDPFTIEMWVSAPLTGWDVHLISKGTGSESSAGSTGWSLRLLGDGTLRWGDMANVITGTTANVTVPRGGGWTHIAVVRTNTLTNGLKIYINGVLHVQGTVTTYYDQTNPILVGAERDRSREQADFGLHGLRISKVARYTTDFVANTGAFYYSTITVDNNTSFLSFLTEGTRPNVGNMGYLNQGWDCQAPQAHNYWHPYFGGWGALTTSARKDTDLGGHSMSFYNGNYNKLLAYTSQSDFTFASDFSIEFYYMPRNGMADGNTYYVLFDMRTTFSDSGIVLNVTQMWGFEVWSSNKVILSVANGDTGSTGKWTHIAIQRLNGMMALYVNGKRVDENYYPSTITSDKNRITIGNGSYNSTNSLRSSNGIYGYISNFRVIKNNVAYRAGNDLPEFFRVPTEPLVSTSETVLLTCYGPSVKDYSTRNNLCYVAGIQGILQENLNDGVGAWDVYTSTHSPFRKNREFDQFEIPTILDNYHPSTGGTYYGEIFGTGDDNSNTHPNLGFVQRFSRPWTVEVWFHSNETSVTSPSAVGVLKTANYDTTNEGFNLVYHRNSGGTASRGCLVFEVICNGTRNRIGTTSPVDSNLYPHCTNHVAVVYDPSKSNKWAMHVNGKRVAITSIPSIFSPHYYTQTFIDAGWWATGPCRVSTVARYDNDSLYNTISYKMWQYDSNTAILINNHGGIREKAMRGNGYCHGGIRANNHHPLFGRSTIFIPNFLYHTTAGGQPGSGHDVAGIVLTNGNGYTTYPYSVRQTDFTIEFWASWFDLQSGGNDIPTGPHGEGACILHRRNSLWCGVNPAGYWNLRVKSANDSNVYGHVIITNISVATKTKGTYDYICIQRQGKNYVFYINGVEQGRIAWNNYGVYNGGPAYNQGVEDYYEGGQLLNIGEDWNGRNDTKWLGWIQDFRMTHARRYETRVINGAPTQVHRGSLLPALPTKEFTTS